MERDKLKFENEIVVEISELQEEAEEDYQRKMTEYRRQHEEWKSWRRRQVLLFLDQCYPTAHDKSHRQIKAAVLVHK